MSGRLAVGAGRYSDRGRKTLNQDYPGVYIAKEPQLNAEVIVIAVADGISNWGRIRNPGNGWRRSLRRQACRMPSPRSDAWG
jgi:hypothetical protein